MPLHVVVTVTNATPFQRIETMSLLRRVLTVIKNIRLRFLEESAGQTVLTVTITGKFPVLQRPTEF